jgi:hypothetical protein
VGDVQVDEHAQVAAPAARGHRVHTGVLDGRRQSRSQKGPENRFLNGRSFAGSWSRCGRSRPAAPSRAPLDKLLKASGVGFLTHRWKPFASFTELLARQGTHRGVETVAVDGPGGLVLVALRAVDSARSAPESRGGGGFRARPLETSPASASPRAEDGHQPASLPIRSRSGPRNIGIGRRDMRGQSQVGAEGVRVRCSQIEALGFEHA